MDKCPLSEQLLDTVSNYYYETVVDDVELVKGKVDESLSTEIQRLNL